jgi:hypothetical protein
MPQYTKYDKTEIFNSTINNKIQELIQLCNAEQLPIFVSVAVANNAEKTEYVNDMFASATNDIFLKNDKFPDFVNVMNGFRTIPPQKIVIIDCD